MLVNTPVKFVQNDDVERELLALLAVRQTGIRAVEHYVISPVIVTPDLMDDWKAARSDSAEAAGGEAAPSAEPASAEEPDAAASDKASETDGATPLPPGPPPLPPGWVEAKDPRYNNATYWFHEVTKETSWVRPLALTLPSPP